MTRPLNNAWLWCRVAVHSGIILFQRCEATAQPLPLVTLVEEEEAYSLSLCVLFLAVMSVEEAGALCSFPHAPSTQAMEEASRSQPQPTTSQVCIGLFVVDVNCSLDRCVYRFGVSVLVVIVVCRWVFFHLCFTSGKNSCQLLLCVSVSGGCTSEKDGFVFHGESYLMCLCVLFITCNNYWAHRAYGWLRLIRPHYYCYSLQSVNIALFIHGNTFLLVYTAGV